MLEYSADEIYSIIASASHPLDQKYDLVNSLKAHIKKEFVELSDVPRFFEALKVANKSSDFQFASLAFSCLCHLIKRVGMQDPNALRGSSKIVLPILFNRLLDPKPQPRQQAKSAIETFWLATPTIVEGYIRDNALIHSNSRIRAESIMFVADLLDLNKNFNFTALLPNVVNLLRDDSIDVVKNAEVLILKYYCLHKDMAPDLIKEFKTQHVESKRAMTLLRSIDVATANAYVADVKANATTSKPTIDTFNNLSKTRKPVYQISSAPMKSTSTQGESKDLAGILGDVQTAKLDGTLRPIAVHSASELNREVDSLLAPFAGKETEFNWGNREKNIVRFRGLVVGNADRYPNELVSATRALLEGINKAILSLRTTLSSNGCQLVKELTTYLAKHLDPIAENLFTPLATLTSATKKIASLNAFGSLCVLLSKTSFNNRLFNQCFSLYQDKNIQPRLYSSTFLQIFILKHGAKLDQANFETIAKWLTKGVSDPNTTVRESMRVTFWILHKKFPAVSEAVYAKQDVSVKKALERCKPRGVEGPTSAAAPANKPGIPQFERKRPSMRDIIASKHRRSTSGPQTSSAPIVPNEAHEEEQNGDLGRPTRIGMPQRVRVSSAGNATQGSVSAPLQRQISKGKQDSQRYTSMGPPSREHTIEVAKVPAKAESRDDTETQSRIEAMKKHLASSLKDERAEGVELLKTLLASKSTLPDISPMLEKLLIMDSDLLKPMLQLPKFFDLMDIELGVKVLAIHKRGIDILLEKDGNERTAEGLVNVVKSLDSLRFANTSFTMFHIKNKSLFLDYSVQNLYRISTDENAKLDNDMLAQIDAAIFPLCISDYPRYDELVVQLNVLNSVVFESTLEHFSRYVKSKIHSILEDFRDSMDDKLLDPTIPVELTMINPFNIKASSAPLMREANSAEMDLDEPERKSHLDDIFGGKGSKYQIEDFTFVGHSNAVQRKLQEQQTREGDHDIEIDESSPEPEITRQTPLQSVEPGHVASPFMDDPYEDDEIVNNSDEGTRNLTSQISSIHISPQKLDIKLVETKPEQKDEFISQDRKSLAEFITKADPIFKRTKKHIQIYEDAPTLLPIERKLFDFELSRIKEMNDEEATIAQIMAHVSMFNNDKIGPKEMNSIIKVLHQAISKEEIIAWMKESGFKIVLGSIINYFNSSLNITKDLCFKGLIVLKELLIIDEFLDNVLSLSEVVSIWNILIMVVENLKDFRNAIYVSVEELVDDLIRLDVPENKHEILKSCLLNLKESETTLATSFLLSSLTKCIEHDQLSLDQIKEIDSTVFKFLTDDEVEVRRLTIITYSKCKRKLQHINYNPQVSMNEKLNSDVNSAERAYNELFAKLSLPQRKLVDYYCEN